MSDLFEGRASHSGLMESLFGGYLCAPAIDLRQILDNSIDNGLSSLERSLVFQGQGNLYHTDKVHEQLSLFSDYTKVSKLY